MTVISQPKDILSQDINTNHSLDLVVNRVHVVAGRINELVHTVPFMSIRAKKRLNYVKVLTKGQPRVSSKS